MPVESGVDMRKTIAIEIVLMRYFWFLLVCVTAMGETIPCYSPVFFTPERRAAVRKNLEEKIPVAGEELAGLKRRFLSLESNDRHFRNRMTYRFELADRLLQQIEEELQTGTTDSVMFARRRFADLLMFRDYFEDELALVVANQRKENLKVVSVKEFGAVGDGVQDDSPAFEQALREFDGHAGFGKLTIPAGSYRLSSGGKPYHLLLKGLRNLEIVGEPENTLIFSDVGARGLELDSCRNVAVRNLILRYADPPFVQGRIEKVEFDGESFLLQSGYRYNIESVADSCTPLAYGEDGRPVFVCNNYGNGRIYFMLYPLEAIIADRPSAFAEGSPDYGKFYRKLAEALYSENDTDLRAYESDCRSLYTTEHIVGEGRRVVVMINYSNKPVTVRSGGISGYKLKRILRGQLSDGKIEIAANDAAVAEYEL